MHPNRIIREYARRLARWKQAFEKMRTGELSYEEFTEQYPTAWVYAPLIRWSAKHRG